MAPPRKDILPGYAEVREKETGKSSTEMLHKGHRQRLRQRIIQSASGTLSDPELLEYLLFITHPRIDVKPIAKALLSEFGSFKKLFSAEQDDLKSVSGVSDAVVAVIKTVQESMKAILREDLKTQTILKSWKSVVDYLRISIANSPVETIRVLFLNKKYLLIREHVQDVGAADHAPLCIKEIVKKCLSCGATAIILAHNHPSGNPLPSHEDLLVTGKLQKICQKIDVQLVDHFIITLHDHFSFVVNGLL